MKNSRGEQFIQHRSDYIERSQHAHSYYEAWITDESAENPDFPVELRSAALNLLNAKEEKIQLSSLHALACVGNIEDISVIQQLLKSALKGLETDASRTIALIKYKNKNLETLLDEVKDRRSFVLFTKALAKEREVAQKEETANPSRYTLNGAHGWNNGDISSFLYSAITEFEDPSSSEDISWKRMAQFLYRGKILE